jgi:hypothetical protein
MAQACLWCADPNADEIVDPEAQLCLAHFAEYEGESIDGLYAQAAGEAYDLDGYV